ncbi:MAG: hypothetical protein HC825_01635 [Oscillatoriales cyanobacterium RM1_1_9]|nr:hypothetical protein [Oscillatoriales cyanobacterium RM1_1_9]
MPGKYGKTAKKPKQIIIDPELVKAAEKLIKEINQKEKPYPPMSFSLFVSNLLEGVVEGEGGKKFREKVLGKSLGGLMRSPTRTSKASTSQTKEPASSSKRTPKEDKIY